MQKHLWSILVWFCLLKQSTHLLLNILVVLFRLVQLILKHIVCLNKLSDSLRWGIKLRQYFDIFILFSQVFLLHRNQLLIFLSFLLLISHFDFFKLSLPVSFNRLTLSFYNIALKTLLLLFDTLLHMLLYSHTRLAWSHFIFSSNRSVLFISFARLNRIFHISFLSATLDRMRYMTIHEFLGFGAVYQSWLGW